MRKLEACRTVGDVDDLITEICRNLPPGHAEEIDVRRKQGDISPTDRAHNPKLDALLAALERREMLHTQSLQPPAGYDGHHPV